MSGKVLAPSKHEDAIEAQVKQFITNHNTYRMKTNTIRPFGYLGSLALAALIAFLPGDSSAGSRAPLHYLVGMVESFDPTSRSITIKTQGENPRIIKVRMDLHAMIQTWDGTLTQVSNINPGKIVAMRCTQPFIGAPVARKISIK